jgi:hypothetical protein
VGCGQHCIGTTAAAMAETALKIARALEFAKKPEARARAIDRALDAKIVLGNKKSRLEKLHNSVNGVVSEGKASDGEIKFGREDEQEIENLAEVLMDIKWMCHDPHTFPVGLVGVDISTTTRTTAAGVPPQTRGTAARPAEPGWG